MPSTHPTLFLPTLSAYLLRPARIYPSQALVSLGLAVGGAVAAIDGEERAGCLANTIRSNVSGTQPVNITALVELLERGICTASFSFVQCVA
jgi:hypothetical protein